MFLTETSVKIIMAINGTTLVMYRVQINMQHAPRMNSPKDLSKFMADQVS